MTSSSTDQLGRTRQGHGPTWVDPAQLREPSSFTAKSRTENFHVLSLLVPRLLVPDFTSVYAFCRHADDLADTASHPKEGLARIDRCESELRACFAGEARSPLFAALQETVERHRLPIEPFLDLLFAFRQDQSTTRYPSWDALLNYCSRSANPVGRLVLMLLGHRDDPAAERLSDATCSALQLVNFWQDVRRDMRDMDRIYIPTDVAAAHGLNLDALRDSILAPTPVANDGPLARAYRATMVDLCARTQALFDKGRPLPTMLSREGRPVVELFGLGGEAVLRRIESIDYRTDLTRPRLNGLRKSSLLLRVWAFKWWRRS